MHFNVKAGSIISSIEYNKAKDGRATTIKINEGTTVQMISIVVPWTTSLLGDFMFFSEYLKK